MKGNWVLIFVLIILCTACELNNNDDTRSNEGANLAVRSGNQASQSTSTPLPMNTPIPTATTPSAPSVIVPEGNVNIRGGPSTDFEIIGQLREGQSLKITGQNEALDWWQVEIDDGPGWVAASVTEVRNAAPVPIVAVPTLGPTEQPAQTTAQVVRIIDGDTIEVLIEGQVYPLRYILMDTPESGSPFAAEATEANRQLVEGKVVRLEKDVSETDRFGRLLRYVYVNDTLVNEELIRQGFATVATFPPDVKYVDRFRVIENEARTAGRGLWAQAVVPTPTVAVAPSDNAEAQVVISHIFYDGVVARVESDEYAEISNVGRHPVDLAGWQLDADDPGQRFTFPTFILAPGQSCRVYTNEIHPESCGFSFGKGQAIWANKGDCGHLFNPAGQEVSTVCY